jgi:hypothetical protein
MMKDAIMMLTHAFITSRMDYCNALYYGITAGLASRLQSVQNAATRLFTAWDDAITSHPFYSNCTGCRFVDTCSSI